MVALYIYEVPLHIGCCLYKDKQILVRCCGCCCFRGNVTYASATASVPTTSAIAEVLRDKSKPRTMSRTKQTFDTERVMQSNEFEKRIETAEAKEILHNAILKLREILYKSTPILRTPDIGVPLYRDALYRNTSI